jgi:transposase
VLHFSRRQNLIFQHDNAREHTARATSDFLEQNNVTVIPWLALSPDLNPIQHLWDEVQRRLSNFQLRPTTADELAASFLRVWDVIPMTFINRLIHSMNRRCAAAINANGGHTSY